MKRGAIGEALIVTGRITHKPVFDLKFDKTGRTLIAACHDDILFISFDNGSLKVANGVWSQTYPPQSCMSIGIIDTTIVTGMFKGSLYLWKSSKFHSSVLAHSGPVTAIHTREGGNQPPSSRRLSIMRAF